MRSSKRPEGAVPFSSWHVGVAAEALAAAQFARLGFDVSVQYGANQPGYDLIVKRDRRLLMVSVKGSKDGGWGLTQSLKKGRSYAAAAKMWADRQPPGVVFCFVQFKGVPFGGLPAMWLARTSEVVRELCNAAGGRGETVLRVRHQWTKRAVGAGTTDSIPDSWVLSQARVLKMLNTASRDRTAT